MAETKTKQVVVVTGASAGVGRATARAFARTGARVGMLARGQDRLEAARREVNELGGEGFVVACDVSDADAVEAAAQSIEDALGPIDIWVNNAMVTVLSPVSDLQSDEIRQATETTYLGTVNGTLSALKRMRARDRGVIVQVGSALAYRAIPLQAAYCASKHAVRGFTDSLRVELMHEKSNVKVTTVHLPALNTPQFDWMRNRLPYRPQPVPPIFQPELAAEAVVWAASAGRREVCVAGSTVMTVWGNKLFPSLVDRYLAATGFEGQQTEERDDPSRPDNLESTVPGPYEARGRFDEVSSASSKQFWINQRRRVIGGVSALGVIVVAALTARLTR